ncbi:MAG: hypothetical protein ACI9QN_002142, partial [Arcticibacterium sp.]
TYIFEYNEASLAREEKQKQRYPNRPNIFD